MKPISYFRCLSYLLILSAPILGCETIIPQEYPPLVPGTYVGTWTQQDSITSVTTCIAIVTEVDSLLQATVQNDSTKEILFLSGHLTEFSNPFLYDVRDSSNIYGRIDTIEGPDANFQFSGYGGDTLTYTAVRARHFLTIVCARK